MTWGYSDLRNSDSVSYLVPIKIDQRSNNYIYSPYLSIPSHRTDVEKTNYFAHLSILRQNTHHGLLDPQHLQAGGLQGTRREPNPRRGYTESPQARRDSGQSRSLRRVSFGPLCANESHGRRIVSHPIMEYTTFCLISYPYTVPSFPVMRSSDAWQPLGRARPFGRKEIGLEVHGMADTMVRILFIPRLPKD